MLPMINVFYQYNLNIIGGIETFLYELARLCSENKRDLTIVYRVGDEQQIRRLRKYCMCIAYSEIKKPIKCKRAFFNYALDIINDVEAEEYIQLVHADFKSDILEGYPLLQSDKITKYYAVSKNNAKSFFELTGKKIDVIYNPLTLDDEPRIMTLVSAQRLTNEKGPKRLEKVITELDKHNIPYIWHIFSNDRLSVNSENVVYHKPTLNIRRWLKHADYTVLLSDTEGFPYTAYESLGLGTPLIITKLPILSELGANSNNSIALDFDLSNLDVEDIYNRAGTFKFSYKLKDKKWLDLVKGESTYVPPTTVQVKVINTYFSLALNRNVNVDEIIECEKARAELLVDKGFATYL